MELFKKKKKDEDAEERQEVLEIQAVTEEDAEGAAESESLEAAEVPSVPEEAKEANWNIDLCTYDLHHEEDLMQDNIMTEYEARFSAQGNPIHKMIISR